MSLVIRSTRITLRGPSCGALMAACVGQPKLPKMAPVLKEFYPPAARRLHEEERVLIEFRLDERRRPRESMIGESDIYAFEPGALGPFLGTTPVIVVEEKLPPVEYILD